MFNGYEKFVNIYLGKCKKIDKIESRVHKTNDRLLGAIDKYDRFLLKVVRHDTNKQAQEIKKHRKGSKKNRKTEKRILNMDDDSFAE